MKNFEIESACVINYMPKSCQKNTDIKSYNYVKINGIDFYVISFKEDRLILGMVGCN